MAQKTSWNYLKTNNLDEGTAGKMRQIKNNQFAVNFIIDTENSPRLTQCLFLSLGIKSCIIPSHAERHLSSYNPRNRAGKI